MLKVGQVKEIYEMKGEGRSIRRIADELGVARNSVRGYLNYPEAMRPKLRARRASNPSTSSGGCIHRVRRPKDVRGAGRLRGAAPGAEGPGVPGQLFDGGPVPPPAAGAPNAAVQRQGRWKHGDMVAHYTRGEAP